MSTMDTSALARIMLGGFGQGAGMVSDAAQILEARQRSAQQQARYEAEVAYRAEQERQQQARQLAQMSALANFAEQRGMLTAGPDPMAYGPQQPPMGGAPSPMGPFQPGIGPATPQAAHSLGLDRATLMGMDPTTARGIVDDMMLQQRQMENAQFEADLSEQIKRRESMARAGRIASIRSQMEQAGFTPEQISRALTAANLSEVGVPAATINGMFPEPAGPAADWSMGQGLGYPEAMRGAFEGGAISPMEAWRARPDTAAVGGDPDAQVADFVRSVEGPFADPADPATWTKLNPTGVEIMRLKMRRSEAITDQVLSAILPESDDRTKMAFLKWQADQMGQRYRTMMNQSTYEGGPSKLDVANAEFAWIEASRAYGQAAMGQGGANAGATPAQPAQPAQMMPTAGPQNDAAAIARQVAGRMFPGVALEQMTDDQWEQVAAQIRLINGGQ